MPKELENSAAKMSLEKIFEAEGINRGKCGWE